MANPWGEWPGDPGVSTWSGVHVTSSSALQLLTVYGCNRFICEGISTLPVDRFRDAVGGAAPMPNPRWLEEPTPDLDRVSWLTQILTSLLLAGNAYLRLGWKDLSLDTLTPLDPTKVSVQRERGRKVYLVAGEPVNEFEMLHIPGVMQPGADVGMSPVEAARQSIGLGLASLEHGSRFFGQGANQSGVIENPGELTPEKAKEIAKSWARKHSGLKNAHLPGVLEGGAHWVPTSVTNEQAQFLETRGYTAAEIAGQMFLIDPSEFGLHAGANGGGSITYANLEQRNARKVQVTFLPWLVRLERAFSGLLPKPQYVKFNVDALIRGDTKTQAEAFAIATGGKSWLLPSEVRTVLDLGPMPGIDDQPAPAPKGATS
jgi:HK97 family phage portal protein